MHITSAKIVMMGDDEADKSALLCQFFPGNLPPFQEHAKSTLGADFCIIELKAASAEVHLYFWELNELESFNTLRKYYLNGMKVFLIVFDLTRPETLEHAYQWYEEAKCVNPEASGILIGTKLDLHEERKIPDEKIDQVSADLGCPVILASTQTGENCENILQELAAMVEPGMVFA